MHLPVHIHVDEEKTDRTLPGMCSNKARTIFLEFYGQIKPFNYSHQSNLSFFLISVVLIINNEYTTDEQYISHVKCDSFACSMHFISCPSLQ